MPTDKLVVMAVGAHPDDIEFMMAGTLLRFGELGAELHMWNLANGHCGTAHHSREEIIALRWAEAQASAAVAGAVMHEPLADDLALFHDLELLRRCVPVVREVKPDILLIPSPNDYMEDHMNASRLMVSAAFARGMVNFATVPPSEAWGGDCVLYHALPYGLRDMMGALVPAQHFVDVGATIETKRAMLSEHRSQKEWLDVSQGLDAYLTTMEEMCAEVARRTPAFAFAEGWRRHNPLGFAADVTRDPLAELLGLLVWTDPEYAKRLG